VLVSLACLLVAASPAVAQQKPAVTAEAARAATAAQEATAIVTLPDKELMTRVLEAWSSLNTDNVSKYYDVGSPFPFYDVSPLKYEAFGDYMTSFKELAANVSSLKFTLNPDAAVRAMGPGWALGTATLHMRMADKDGKAQELDGRWTVVWQKKPSGWIIVHDHFSVPAPLE
jgi:ketosteroid isomerase-like protein